MSDESAERRGWMLELQADAEEQELARSAETRQSVHDQQIQTFGREKVWRQDYFTFMVDADVARARLGEWSDPVRFKFEEAPEGHLVMVMQTVPKHETDPEVHGEHCGPDVLHTVRQDEHGRLKIVHVPKEQ